MVDRKSRIDDNLMKIHLSLTQVPYYCKLRLFRCQKREQVDQHVEVHKRHKLMAEKRNIKDSSVWLVANAKPHVIGPGTIWCCLVSRAFNTFWIPRNCDFVSRGRDIQCWQSNVYSTDSGSSASEASTAINRSHWTSPSLKCGTKPFGKSDTGNHRR